MRRRLHQFLEVICLSSLIFLWNLFFSKDPLFSNLLGAPYGVLTIAFALFYGWAAGVAAWVMVLFWAAITLGFVIPPTPQVWLRLWNGAVLFLILFSVFLFLRTLTLQRNRAVRQRFREVVRKNHLLRQENRTFHEALGLLETRLSKQKKFLTFLLTKLNSLDKLNLQKALDEILDTIRIFTGAEKASIWRFHPEEKNLYLVASLGWEGVEETRRSSENSLEGWVCRNGTLFSLRMVLTMDHYKKMDKGENIIAFPVRIGEKVWGVLNIEKMPFREYSRYTESVVEIIVKLAEKSLRPIIEHEQIFRQMESDERTGLPFASVFFRLLHQEVPRLAMEGGLASIVLIEVVNFDDLVSASSPGEFKILLLQLAFLVRQQEGANAECFHYKNDSQLAFYLPNLDKDGAALFCLNLLSLINSQTWTLGGQQIYLDLVLGYSTLQTGILTPEALVEQAESLIMMQKV